MTSTWVWTKTHMKVNIDVSALVPTNIDCTSAHCSNVKTLETVKPKLRNKCPTCKMAKQVTCTKTCIKGVQIVHRTICETSARTVTTQVKKCPCA